jgi:ADP-heptose:LPS heptosyltransferase
MLKPNKILISRTDSIGDVILTLPMAGILKKRFPNVSIVFLGKNYTKSIIETSEHIDEFLSIDDLNKLNPKEQIQFIRNKNISHCIHVFPKKEIAQLMKKSGVQLRIGTANRAYHWLTCNKLIKLSRKNSDLHEAQLNCKLLSAVGINEEFSLVDLAAAYGFTKHLALPQKHKELLSKDKKNIIIHAKSQGNAVEWGLENFSKLISKIDKEKFQVFISGTQAEGQLLQPLIKNNPDAVDLTGKLSLPEFISFINEADILIAASTGPLHICAALGKKAIGLFLDKRPIHPGRWAPIGKDTHVVLMNNDSERELQQILNLTQAQ